MAASVTKRVFYAVGMGWFSRIVAMALNIVLLPVLIHRMGQEELALWILLSQSGAFLGLMDFGFSATLTRRIARAKGLSGSAPDVPLNDESRALIADLMTTSARLYHVLALAAFVLWLPLAGLLLHGHPLGNMSWLTVALAWTILCLNNSMTTWASRYQSALDALGYIGWDSIASALVSALTLAAQIVAVILGGGLVALASIAMISSILLRLITVYLLRKREPRILRDKGHFRWDLIRDMSRPALRYWITALGGFLCFRTGQYFIDLMKGVADVPKYQGALVIVQNMGYLSGVFATVSGVFISQLWQAGELTQIHRLVQRNMRLMLLLMCGGTTFLALAGEQLFGLWLGPGMFVGHAILLILCLTWTLENHQFVLSSASRATEDEVYAPWSLAAGFINLLLCGLLVGRWGVLGVVVSLFVAQLVTTHWYGSYRGMRRLKLSIRKHISHNLLPVASVVVVAAAAGWAAGLGAQHWTIHQSAKGQAVARVAAVFGAVSLVNAVALYFLVLEPAHRAKIPALFGLATPPRTDSLIEAASLPEMEAGGDGEKREEQTIA